MKMVTSGRGEKRREFGERYRWNKIGQMLMFVIVEAGDLYSPLLCISEISHKKELKKK